MKKVLLSTLVLVGIYSTSFAQSRKNYQFNVGTDVALPLGEASDVYNVGYGGSVQGELNLIKNLDLTASAAYMQFRIKKEVRDLLKGIGDDSKSSAAIPIKLGAKLYVLEKFYVAAEAGASISTEKDGGTAFAYSPTVGTKIQLSDRHKLDIGLRFEGWSKDGVSHNFIGLKTAFGFIFK